MIETRRQLKEWMNDLQIRAHVIESKQFASPSYNYISLVQSVGVAKSATLPELQHHNDDDHDDGDKSDGSLRDRPAVWFSSILSPVYRIDLVLANVRFHGDLYVCASSRNHATQNEPTDHHIRPDPSGEFYSISLQLPASPDLLACSLPVSESRSSKGRSSELTSLAPNRLAKAAASLEMPSIVLPLLTS